MFIFVGFGVQLPTFQCITTNVSDNNKQYRYISVLLLWSQIVLVYCFSGKCLMHRTVWNVWGKVTFDSCYLKTWNVRWVTVQRKYVPLMLLRAYRVAGLYVNMQRDNTEMGIKGKVLVIKWTENYLSIHIRNIIIVSNDIWQKMMSIFSW